MNDFPRLNLTPMRGNAAPIPPGVAATPANDVSLGFATVLQLALDAPAMAAGARADAQTDAHDAEADPIDSPEFVAWPQDRMNAALAPEPIVPAEAIAPSVSPPSAATQIAPAPLGLAPRAHAKQSELAPATDGTAHRAEMRPERPPFAATPALSATPAMPATPASEDGTAAAATPAMPATPAAPVVAEKATWRDRPESAPPELPASDPTHAAHGVAVRDPLGQSHAQSNALHVGPRVGTPGFDEAFAARVSVAVRAGVESASIALNPPELGPVEMRISVANGEAHIAFAAEQPVTREALNDALPRLREMLAAHGLELAGGSVGAELPQREPAASPPAATTDGKPAADDEPAAAARPLAVAAPRLVDTFV